jgi:hypothetical protein
LTAPGRKGGSELPQSEGIHQPPHSNLDTLGSGFAIMSPPRITAQLCHQPVGFAKSQGARVRRNIFFPHAIAST